MNPMMRYPKTKQSTGKPARWFSLKKLHRRLPIPPVLSSPLKMTSAVVANHNVLFATGARIGSMFQITSCLTTTLTNDGTNFVDDPGSFDINSQQMCLNLPRQQTISRYLRVPSSNRAELAAMVPYQLAVDLPLALDEICWTSSIVTQLDDGFCLVLVQLVRIDQVDQLIQPFQQAGFCVEGLVPEGWAWAHLLHEHLGDMSDPVSALIPHPDGKYLIVAQAGKLLYDTLLIATDGDDLELAGKKYTEIFGHPLPEPVAWPPPSTEDNRADHPTTAFFGGSLAASGLFSSRYWRRMFSAFANNRALRCNVFFC